MASTMARAAARPASLPPTRQPKAPMSPADLARKRAETRRLLAGRQSKVLAVVNEALVAAAQQMSDPDMSPTAATPATSTRTWQHMVLAYSDSIPELGSASMYVGNCLSQVKLQAVKRGPDGVVNEMFEGGEPVEGVDPQVAEWTTDIMGGLRSAIGGQSELLRRYGEQMFLVGELYFLGVPGPAGFTTECLSVVELVKEGKGTRARYKRIIGDGSPDQILDQGVEPLRIWRPDRRFSRLASSSVKSCITILDELDVLTRLVKASAVCRLALSGVLLIPDELDQPLDGASPDDLEAMHPLVFDIIKAATQAIDDPSSAHAFMPYLLQGAATLLSEVRHIPFQTAGAEQVVQRAEAIQRLAQGLDLEPEKLTGLSNSTFANAARIGEDEFNLRLKPSCEMLADAITEGILWPKLAAKLGLSPDRVAEVGYPDEILAVGVHYDASGLISHPDKAKDIVELVTKDKTQTIVAIHEAREAVGLPAEGAPDDEEVARRLDAYRLAQIKETIAAPASDAAVPLDQAAKAVIPGQSAGQDLIGQQAKAAEAAPVGETVQQATVSVTASASPPMWVWQVAGAADMTIERIAERVGAKVRSKLAAGSSEADAIAGRPNEQVASILGPDVVSRALGREDIVGFEIASFSRLVARHAADSGRAHPGVLAEGLAKLVAAHARDRLYGAGGGQMMEALLPLLAGV